MIKSACGKLALQCGWPMISCASCEGSTRILMPWLINELDGTFQTIAPP